MGSARQDLATKEFREFVKEEERKEREAADRAEYKKYVEEIEAEQRRCSPAERIEPLTFDQWRKFIPEELKDAPAAVRGAAASARSTMTRVLKVGFDIIKAARMSDEDLSVLGFDVDDRIIIPEAQLSIPAIVDVFRRFAKSEPLYRQKLHFDAIADFLTRNRLIPSQKHVALAFTFLLGTHAISVPEPEPEPERPPGVNRYGVNLTIERDPEFDAREEARKKIERYETEVVVTDPETGKGYTEYALDRVDSETFRRLMRIPRISEYRPEPQR